MHYTFGKALARSLMVMTLTVSLLIGAGSSYSVSAQSATLATRSLKLASSTPGANTRYEVSFSGQAQPALGSIKIEFCSNTTLFALTCNPPAGFSAAGAVLSSQSGEVGFSIHPSSTANMIVLSRPPAASGTALSAYNFDNIQSASAVGTQYARYSSYAADDGTGTILDYGGVAYALAPLLSLSTEVPPYIELCVGNTIASVSCSSVTGNYLNLGQLSATAPRAGTTQMVISTNASNGYIITMSGRTLTAGTNAINALTSPTTSQPGVNQFGVNLRDNSQPDSGSNPSGPGAGNPASDYNIPNRFLFRPGDTVASSSAAENYRKYTTTYLVNISSQQPAGIYTGTYTYTGFGNF